VLAEEFRGGWLFFLDFGPVPRRNSSNRQNWKLEKNGDSGVKPVMLKCCRCTTYYTAPRNIGRDNAAGLMIIWGTSPPRILQIHSMHQVTTDTPSPSASWNNYHHFSRFWDQLYVFFRLGLSTEVRLRVQFLLKTDSGYSPFVVPSPLLI